MNGTTEYGKDMPAQSGAEAPASLGENIARLRMLRGISRSELAREMHMTLGGVSAWEYGRTRPDLDSVKRLCAALSVSSDELLGLKQTETLTPEERALLDSYRALPERERLYISEMTRFMRIASAGVPVRTDASQTEIIPLAKARRAAPEKDVSPCSARPAQTSSRRYVTLPVNELAMCAGDGVYLSDGSEGERLRLLRCAQLEACDEIVRVSGSSMEPMYSDGDLALVTHTQTLREGEIGVFVIDGEGMIKQYRADGLYPLNNAYDVIRPGEYASVRCFGRVTGKVTKSMLP